MRRLPLLLLLAPATVAVADDMFPLRLQAFEEARAFTLEAGGQARVYPALEALVATGDVRAVAPIASYLLETITSERRLFEDLRNIQKQLAEAASRAEAIDKELTQLDLKEKAGDRTVGPSIEERKSERAMLARQADHRAKEMEQIDRTVGFLRELRGRLVGNAVTLLKGRTGDEAKTAIAAVRRALDVADKDQALVLVRIFGESDLAEAEDQLLEILAAPKADSSVRLRAQYALAHHLSRRGAEALLRIWERDPKRSGVHAQHVLSLAAKKRLATIEEARAWVGTLP
ncbi:MAG TPA: hypothetical protein VFY93_10135 [Planctomycetota bacterium]|nr:hypothetical protein [Planctomycetota bacterium]